MNIGAPSQPALWDLRDREVAIINHLRRLDSGAAASVREIWEAVTTEIGDSVTVQAYHKIMDRLVVMGKAEYRGEDPARGKLFGLAPYLHSGNAATLDDIHEWLTSSLPPSEVIAKAMSAMDYFEENKERTLKRAAEALQKEDPVDLFYEMLVFYLASLQADINIYNHNDPMTGAAELRGSQVVKRLLDQYHWLSRLLYRALSIPTEVVNITDVPKAQVGAPVKISVDRDSLKDVLSRRIFGERFIMEVDVSGQRGTDSWLRMSVAGSDGSTHSGVLAVQTARAFLEEQGLVLTFNNSMVYLHESLITNQKILYPFHSVPMTRSALDDPSNKGMILVPVMFRDELSDSEYEHMAKCATDVVQWRVDAAVFGGRARALNSEGAMSMRQSKLLPPPAVHIRDGTVTPQEREFKHYDRLDSYGDFVREGIRLSKEILEKVAARRNDNLRVFGGATKSTELRIYSKLLNWYISTGSQKLLGQPIDPHWDDKRASLVSDNEAMTVLLSSISDRDEIGAGKFYVTCAVARQFHSLTDHWLSNLPASSDDDDADGWREFFQRKRELKAGEQEPFSYLDMADLDDDPFVWMCGNADYGMFYIGHTAGSPPPLLPRYEFMDSLRKRSSEEATERVKSIVEKALEALYQTGFQLDQDHNYMTNKKNVKIIPSVVYVAHEHSKAIGKQFESELKSLIVARLQNDRLSRVIKPSDIEIMPMPVREYVERYRKALEEELLEEPDKLLR